MSARQGVRPGSGQQIMTNKKQFWASSPFTTIIRHTLYALYEWTTFAWRITDQPMVFQPEAVNCWTQQRSSNSHPDWSTPNFSWPYNDYTSLNSRTTRTTSDIHCLTTFFCWCKHPFPLVKQGDHILFNECVLYSIVPPFLAGRLQSEYRFSSTPWCPSRMWNARFPVFTINSSLTAAALRWPFGASLRKWHCVADDSFCISSRIQSFTNAYWFLSIFKLPSVCARGLSLLASSFQLCTVPREDRISFLGFAFEVSDVSSPTNAFWLMTANPAE